MEEINVNPVEGNQETVKTKKKRNRHIPKIFKNRVFIFVFLTILTMLAAFLLLLIDDSNSMRNLIGIKPQSVAWLRNLFHLDVTILTWVIFAIIVVAVFFISFIISFRKPIKKGIENKKRIKKGEGFTKKGTVIFHLVFFGIIAVLLAVAALGVIMMVNVVHAGDALGQQFSSLTTPEQFVAALVSFLKSAAILLVTILIVPAIVVIFLLLYKLIVLLFGGVAGGIAKNVMASSNFQETYAAAQAASNKINEMANQLPKTISVVAERSTFIESGENRGSGFNGSFGLKSDGTIFPALEAIDLKHAPKEEQSEEKPEKTTTKKEKKETPVQKREDFSTLVDEFQAYLAKEEKLYFSKQVLRTFIAGLSASRLILLEGLSGTGKSSLPRKFQQFIGGKSCFLPVQATWRDRTDIIGYYSDLTGYYKETELLKSVYESLYTPNEINLIVLDEMNISRAEYYFADFLSIYEYPSDAWKVQLMQTSSDMKLPKLIDNGALQIPTNIWFVGTINVDDSTFTVTDKVYDRAIVINFNAINNEFDVKSVKDYMPVSYEDLNNFFIACRNDKKLCFNKEDKKTLYELLLFLDETFDIKVGNRVFNQIEAFVPVFVGLGGSKLEALDMMISAKIFRKLDNVFVMEMGDSLIKLQRFLHSNYKKGKLPCCEAKINSLLKKYQ